MAVKIGEVSAYVREVLCPKVMLNPSYLAVAVNKQDLVLTSKERIFLEEIATQARLRLALASSSGDGISYQGL